MDPFDHFKTNGSKRRFFDQIEEELPQKKLRTRLEDVLGPLKDSDFDLLKQPAQANFELAVNEFLDGSHRSDSVPTLESTPVRSATPELLSTVTEPTNPADADSLATSPSAAAEASPPQQSQVPSSPHNWEERLLGSFQAEIWCTRSGRNMVQYGDTLRVERLPSTSGKEDYIVRLYTTDGRDFARMREGDAKFMAVLMDTGVCRFVGTCIFADTTLRVGDSVIVQIDCYMLRSAFEKDLLEPTSATVTTRKPLFNDEAKEQGNERIMRLRQLGIVQLYARLGLAENKLPSMLNALDQVGAAMSQTQNEDEEGKEVTTDQMDVLYRSIGRAELPQTEPADSFAMKLFPYQKRGLHWMLQRESGDVGASAQIHPLWTRFVWPETNTPFYTNLYSGELSLELPTLETTSMGGILADEMGLGKTISTLSLIHTGKGKLTLIVAPMSLLSQWESEVRQASKPNSVHVLVYYGGGMADLLAYISLKSDSPKIIITSYGVVVSEHKTLLKFRENHGQSFTNNVWNKDPAILGLFGIEFYRVVLDEAHTIKNRATKTAKACYDLRSAKRWALTGTPIVNRLEDLYSLVKFLGLEPWNNFSFWKAFITVPFESAGGAVTALQVVQSIVSPLCLRRTKTMKEDGKPLVELPEKLVEIRRIPFSNAERDLYSFVFARIRSSVADQLADGTVTKSYTTLLALIMRLRQICCHPLLIKKTSSNPEEAAEADTAQESGILDLADKDLAALVDQFKENQDNGASLDTFSADVMKGIVEATETECPICCTEPIPMDSQALTECFHMACLDCILQHIEYQKAKGDAPKCFLCRTQIQADKLFTIQRTAGKIKLQRHMESMQSAKIKALLQELRQNPGNGKNVVFSQFTSFLDIIQAELRRQGLHTVRFDGSMSQQQRATALEDFRNYPKDVVLLLSLKAGGVGLNLVCAQQAFLMDPWWSYAVESQAIDRIHRMGQTADVRVVRFIIEGTLEERMLKVQERKKALSSVVTEEERKTEQIQDIRVLFDLDKLVD